MSWVWMAQATPKPQAAEAAVYEDDEFLPSHTQHLPASQNLSLSLLGMIRLEGSHYRDACGGVKSGPSKICLPEPFKCGPYLEEGSLQME